MKSINMFWIISIVAMLFTACEKEINDFSGVESAKSQAESWQITDQVFTSSADDLTAADIEGLMLMREEEMLAHDLYTAFFGIWGEASFDRISVSETAHAASVLNLIVYFGLNDPATGEAGLYNNDELQALYNQLLAAGNESAEAALATGALIEETDIADLQNLIASTGNPDLIRVYTHLLEGSYQHLKAFASLLTAYGIVYQPQVLNEADYTAILSTGSQGHGRNGTGDQSGTFMGRGSNPGTHSNGSNQSGDTDGDGICDVTGDSVSYHSNGSGAGGGDIPGDLDGDGICDTPVDSVQIRTNAGSSAMGRNNSQGWSNGH